MKKILIISTLVLTQVATSCSQEKEIDTQKFTNFTGPYFGQTVPGNQLVQFAPGIVPEMHSTVTVSTDGMEIYWTTNTAIIMTEYLDNRWTVPEVISLSGKGTTLFYDDVPVVSPDNTKLYFVSQRPIGTDDSNKENIWFAERSADGWSEPQPLPQVINSMNGIHWAVSVSNTGTLYFKANHPDPATPCIFFSRYNNGEYLEPEPLEAINSFGRVVCPFIAPDESYIIFCKVVDGIGYMHISFRGNDNQWLTPQRIEKFPTFTGPCSFVTRDGRYIFLGNMWISAEIIEDMRPD